MIQIKFAVLLLFLISSSGYASASSPITSEKIVAEFNNGDLAKKRILLKALSHTKKKDLFHLFKNLITHEDEYIRLYAFKAISNFKNDEAFLLLSNALSDKSKVVARGSIPLFAKFNSEKSLNIVTSQLKNQDLIIKQNALKTLGYIGTINTINLIAPFMNEKEPFLKLEAVKAASLIIKRTGFFFTTDIDADYEITRKTNGLNSAEKLTSTLIPVIKKMVTDSNAATEDKAESITCLSLLAKNYLDKLNTYTMFEEDEKLILKAKNIHAAILSLMPELIKSFGSQDDLVRWSIVKLFKDYQDKAAIPVFVSGLKDSYYPVRVASIEGLVLLNHAESADKIVTLLKDDVNVVRVAAIEAAISFKMAEEYEKITALLSEYDNQVKWSATKALGALGDGGAVNDLNLVAKSEESFLRVMAINSLGELASEDGFETVVLALKDNSALVREAAASALKNFEKIKNVHKNLAELTEDQSRDVRLAALKSMDFIIKGDVTEEIGKALISAITKLSTDTDLRIRTKRDEILNGLNK